MRTTNSLTDAQFRAITAIGARVFGHSPTDADFATITERPVDELTPSEASTLIDKLRAMLAAQMRLVNCGRRGE